MTILAIPGGFALQDETGVVIPNEGEKPFTLEQVEAMLDRFDNEKTT